MKNKLILTGILLSTLAAHAQFKVKTSNSTLLDTKKAKKSYSFSIGSKSYFMLAPADITDVNYNLLSVSADNDLVNLGSIGIPGGTFNNYSYINSAVQMGDKAFAFVQTLDKSSGKNKMSVRSFDANGEMKKDEKEIGAIDYTKRINPGDWFVASTPDKKHAAVLAVYVSEKGEYQRCKYYFIDDAMNVVFSKELTVYADKKKNFSFQLFASDRGDLYLIDEEFEKGSRYPVLYKKMIEDTGLVQYPILLKDNLKTVSYTAAVGPDGNLGIAGYCWKKATLTMGDKQSDGEWFMNTAKPGFVSTQMFDKGIANTVARGVVFNDNIMYLVGEQMLAERQPSAPGAPPFEENYNYKLGNILVSGYDPSADTKFDLQLPRSLTARNDVQDLFPAFGMVNGKLTIVYNDLLKKYKKTDYDYLKVPVSVTITKEGLMEQPSHYENELKTESTSYRILPIFFYAKPDRMIVLSADNENGLRAVSFMK